MAEPTFQSVALGFAAAAKGLQALKELVSGDARAQVTALYDIILGSQASAMEAHLKQTAMIDEIRTLKEEIARVKAWETQKQRYKLYSPWSGATVYALKKSMAQGEPSHWICTHCYDNGRRSILQYATPTGEAPAYLCPSCKAAVHYPLWGVPEGELPYAVE